MIQVIVRNSTASGISQAIRYLKLAMQKNGVYSSIRRHRHYIPPSIRQAERNREAKKRQRKLSRSRDGFHNISKTKSGTGNSMFSSLAAMNTISQQGNQNSKRSD